MAGSRLGRAACGLGGSMRRAIPFLRTSCRCFGTAYTEQRRSKSEGGTSGLGQQERRPTQGHAAVSATAGDHVWNSIQGGWKNSAISSKISRKTSSERYTSAACSGGLHQWGDDNISADVRGYREKRGLRSRARCNTPLSFSFHEFCQKVRALI